MPFLSEKAADTLAQTIQALQAAWATLPAAARRGVEQAIMAHGPKIAAADMIAAPAAIVALLEALWAQAGDLPAAVVQALEAGQGSPPAVSYRSAPAVSAGRRDALLAGLIALADFRLFEDPRSAAEAVIRLVAAHDDRLTAEERAAWQKLYDALARGGDPQTFLRGVEALLGGYPAVKALLVSRKAFVLRTEEILRGMAPKGLSEIPKMAMMPAATSSSGGDLVRFANVYFPATILLTQKDVPLVIHVAQRYSAKSALTEEAGRMTLKVGDLTIVVQAEGFDVTESLGGLPVEGGAAGRIVKVEPERDCEPVVFLLTPQSVGAKRINIHVDQFGRNVLTQAITVQVVADLCGVNDLANVRYEPLPVTSPTRGAGAPAPDLELRVMLAADKRKLSFMLHGGGVYHYRPMGEVELQAADPYAYLLAMRNRLSALAGRSAATRTAAETEAARRELAALGNSLYRDLFPESLKAEYARTIRTRFDGKSLLITSDEPWIPWEMVRPAAVDEATGEILYDDPPLCEKFCLSRWLTGRGAPDQLAMKEGAWVAPAGSAPEAEAENRYFQELHRRQWQVKLTGPLTQIAEVQARLASRGVHLFHFACHGNFEAANPEDSMLKLADGYFKPAQIDTQIRASLTAARPLVFLNACHSGEVGFALTGAGGWAAAFFQAGAGAFIGSQWEINGKLAARFAQEFYDRLWGVNSFEGRPQPLGQAFHEARLALKAADEANPTWLAYVLYGDPYGQVILGG